MDGFEVHVLRPDDPRGLLCGGFRGVGVCAAATVEDAVAVVRRRAASGLCSQCLAAMPREGGAVEWDAGDDEAFNDGWRRP